MTEEPIKDGSSGAIKKNDSVVRFTTDSDAEEQGSSHRPSSANSSINADVDPGGGQLLRYVLSSSSLASAGRPSITYGHQGQLPRLPIPSLEDTLHKFSTITMPALLSEEEKKTMKRAVAEFMTNEGPILQKALLDYDKECIRSGEVGSYVEEFWNESYLSPDASVVLNLNPFFVLEDGPDPKINKNQLKRAARLCFASLKIASALKNETLEPDTFKGKPLCMDQFKVLFGASRQPTFGNSMDEVHVYRDSTHVVVLCNNQFYYFPVLWPGSYDLAVDEEDIYEILQAIELNAMEMEQDRASKEAFGVFTSLPRSEWAAARLEMCKDSETNRNSLKIIDSALFVLALDNFEPTTIHEAAANMLHGTNKLAAEETAQIGTCLNRWYDKLQIIVCKDATAGINFEHSSIDGHTALRFVSDVFAETVIAFAESIVDLIHGRGRIQHVVQAKVDRAAIKAATNKNEPVLDVFPKKLTFELGDSIKQQIYFAETALCDELGASDTWNLEFRDYGKSLIVANKLSPDSFVQMSILLAYYKLYGKVVCMYEPVMTKSFYHGRTEAMRSATVQAKELCQIWCDHNSTNAQKLAALRCATTEHSRLVAESAVGKGVDRHLYSLKCIAEKKGLPVPAFFQSHAWKALNHTVLSTSNCGNPALRLFGFGPVVPDGFGIGYIIKDYQIAYSVSSKHRQTLRYVRSLRTTLREMHSVLMSTSAIQPRRTNLIDVKETISRQFSGNLEYPDVWGERSGPPTNIDQHSPLPQVNKHESHRHSKAFSKVVERHDSFGVLFGTGLDVELPYKSDG